MSQDPKVQLPQLDTYLSDARLSAALCALRPRVIDEKTARLLAPAIARLLAEDDDGTVIVPDATGRARFGKRGALLDAGDAVTEFRAQAALDNDWLVTKMFVR